VCVGIIATILCPIPYFLSLKRRTIYPLKHRSAFLNGMMTLGLLVFTFTVHVENPLSKLDAANYLRCNAKDHNMLLSLNLCVFSFILGGYRTFFHWRFNEVRSLVVLLLQSAVCCSSKGVPLV